jgi:hypothetical protein
LQPSKKLKSNKIEVKESKKRKENLNKRIEAKVVKKINGKVLLD